MLFLTLSTNIPNYKMSLGINSDSIVEEIRKFEDNENGGELSSKLEDYLKFVARTGDPLLPWNAIKNIIKYKLNKTISEFYDLYGGEEYVETANTPPFSFVPTRTKILQHFDSLAGAPFTIQRLCELLVDPKRHYTRTDKFLRGLEKNVYVVSFVEPGCSRRPLEPPEAEEGLSNGLQDKSPPSHNTKFGLDAKFPQKHQQNTALTVISSNVDGVAEDRVNGSGLMLTNGIVDGCSSPRTTTSSPDPEEISPADSSSSDNNSLRNSETDAASPNSPFNAESPAKNRSKNMDISTSPSDDDGRGHSRGPASKRPRLDTSPDSTFSSSTREISEAISVVTSSPNEKFDPTNDDSENICENPTSTENSEENNQMTKSGGNSPNPSEGNEDAHSSKCDNLPSEVSSCSPASKIHPTESSDSNNEISMEASEESSAQLDKVSDEPSSSEDGLAQPSPGDNSSPDLCEGDLSNGTNCPNAPPTSGSEAAIAKDAN